MKVEEKDEKVFTKSKTNNIMKETYNLSEVNYGLIYEREGLYMEGKNETLDEIVKELSKECGKKEKVIRIMIEKCIKLGYNIESSKRLVRTFYSFTN